MRLGVLLTETQGMTVLPVDIREDTDRSGWEGKGGGSKLKGLCYTVQGCSSHWNSRDPLLNLYCACGAGMCAHLRGLHVYGERVSVSPITCCIQREA